MRISILLVAAITSCTGQPPPPKPVPTTSILIEVNAYRAQHGLKPYAQSQCLTAHAQSHSDNMNRTRVLSHNGWTSRLAACGMGPGSENVAWGWTDAHDLVFNGWAKSSGHRANMLGNYKQAGAAFSGSYSTLMIGTPAMEGALVKNEEPPPTLTKE